MEETRTLFERSVSTDSAARAGHPSHSPAPGELQEALTQIELGMAALQAAREQLRDVVPVVERATKRNGSNS